MYHIHPLHHKVYWPSRQKVPSPAGDNAPTTRVLPPQAFLGQWHRVNLSVGFSGHETKLRTPAAPTHFRKFFRGPDHDTIDTEYSVGLGIRGLVTMTATLPFTTIT